MKNKLSDPLTLLDVRTMIEELKTEADLIYKLVPQSKTELLKMKMKRLGIRILK